jgi:hypothetical protein
MWRDTQKAYLLHHHRKGKRITKAEATASAFNLFAEIGICQLVKSNGIQRSDLVPFA